MTDELAEATALALARYARARAVEPLVGQKAATDAEVAAERAVSKAELVYELTEQVLGQEELPLIFPLIALSAMGVVEGLAAYERTVERARSRLS
ncbi:MAG: hypothetical protein AAF493_07660 [Pseudomonadota bacterium]